MELAALESRRSLERRAPLALKPLLEELVASAQAAGAARQLSVTLDAPHEAWVDGDAFLLRRALSNLLDNALDFSPAGGTVELALAGRPRSVDITVRDHGPGVPEYAYEKVFEKFYSLARPHSQKKSTGLGLSFVKEIADLHDGRVSLRNAEGGGAVATLSLPKGAGATAA
jgi:two-component system sensor histidine kinase CreC